MLSVCTWRKHGIEIEFHQVEKLTQDKKKGLMKSNTSPSTESTEIQLENQGKVQARIRAIEQKRKKKDVWIEED